MNKYNELLEARDDMKSQNELYRPTSFWDEASQAIVDDIELYGIDKFRSLSTPLSYFVPTYGLPGNSFSEEDTSRLIASMNDSNPEAKKPMMALKEFLNGYSSALADYRVLLASDDQSRLPNLHNFSESTFGSPVEQFEFDGKRYSRSSLNYLLGLCLLKKHLNEEVPQTVLEIGGGFGTLGEVLSSSGIDQMKYIDIDIPPTSFVAQRYLSEVYGESNVATYAKTKELDSIEINDLPVASVLCSWQIEKLKGKVDLFVNFISFQEMEPNVVENYLYHIDRLEAKWILLRNMREGKNIRKDGSSAGVETPILSEDYRKMLNNYELIESNVFPFGYKTVDNFHSELQLLKRKG